MAILSRLNMTASYIAHSAYRFVQMILALAVVGLYAQDLNAANKAGKYTDGKWVFAVVTSSLSAVTALLYMIPFVVRVPFLFVWDLILFILWISVFGIFGNLFIKENAEGNGGIKRMKNAVWVDLVNALLWLISAIGMAIYWAKHRGNRSQFTGRATV